MQIISFICNRINTIFHLHERMVANVDIKNRKQVWYGNRKFKNGYQFISALTSYFAVFSLAAGAIKYSGVPEWHWHYNNVIMGAMASQITSLTTVYSIIYLGAERKHQSSASLAFVWGIHRSPVNSPHKGPGKRKMFSFDDVIMA